MGRCSKNLSTRRNSENDDSANDNNQTSSTEEHDISVDDKNAAIEDIKSEDHIEGEKRVVQATIPDHYPEVTAVPVNRRPVFPGFYKTITIRDPQVVAALTEALKSGRPYVGLFLQRDSDSENDASKSSNVSSNVSERDASALNDRITKMDDVYPVGVFAKIINVIPMPSPSPSSANPAMTVIVYPHRRIRAVELLTEPGAQVSRMRTENVKEESYTRGDRTIRALTQEIFSTLADVAKLNAFFREHIAHHNVPPGVFEEAGRLADFVAVLSGGESGELQAVLEESQVEARLRQALLLLKRELVTAQLQQRISKEVEERLSQRQREYLLHEQLKAIKRELGLETDAKERLLDQFRRRLLQDNIVIPKSVKDIMEEEINKLAVLEPAGAEFSVTRNYLDWLSQLPWGHTTSDTLDVEEAKRILDEDHYGLTEVKERILEFIAVGRMRGRIGGKILCLVGPPGVGKTSIGRSVARALGRIYYRFSVGGLADVAEIKGHRRTYVGAMPGKMVQALRRTGAFNPLVLIDELDKVRSGPAVVGGDPAGALLELLDPEQNSAFLDHYLDVPVDLSQVLFMATANTTDTIPPALLDRLEVIRLSGYVGEEKLHIALHHLMPQAREATGLTEQQVQLTSGAVSQLIRQYCREAGVRNLKRHIEKVYRKAALHLVKEQATDNTEATTEESTVAKDSPPSSTLVIDEHNLKDFVGNPIHLSERLYEGSTLPPGLATGLAWTSLGGSILYMETIIEHSYRPKGDGSEPPNRGIGVGLIKTGCLGDVMKESSSIAYSYSKAFLSQNSRKITFSVNQPFIYMFLKVPLPRMVPQLVAQWPLPSSPSL